VAQANQDAADIVWTGDRYPGLESRDTYVVVQELFAAAKHSILIASYVLDRGTKNQALFTHLAQRMEAEADLQVRLFLNVMREDHYDKTPQTKVLQHFAQNFRQHCWPGHRYPEVFYFQPALSTEPGARSCLHAKCIVIDDQQLFLTSANFTEAAHHRNIEAGVLMFDPVAARGLRSQIDILVAQKVFHRVPGL